MSSGKRLLAITLAVVGVAAAGTAGGFYLATRRDVTTSSAEAYRFYKLGRENELKMYEKEATAAYAEALKHDCQFPMAILRLARTTYGRDPERARSLVESVARGRDQLMPREELCLRILEALVAKKESKAFEALYDEYVTRFPDEAEGHLLRGIYLMNHERSVDARSEFEKLLALNPNDATAYNYLGYDAFVTGDYAKAEGYFKRYRFLAPDQANPYDSLGELYANTGRYEEAEDSLKKALSIKSDFLASYGNLATAEIGRGNPLAAAGHFRKAAELAEGAGARSEWRRRAVLCLIDAGQREEALKEIALTKAEVANAGDAERAALERVVPFWNAVFLARLGQADEAEAELAAFAARGDPESTPEHKKYVERDVQTARGLIAFARGKHADVVTALEKAFEGEPLRRATWFYPVQLNARILLAESLRQLGRPKEAEEALAPVLALNSRFQPAVTLMARLRGAEPAGTR